MGVENHQDDEINGDTDLDRGDELYPERETDGEVLDAVLSATDGTANGQNGVATPDDVEGNNDIETGGEDGRGAQRVPISRLNEVIAKRNQEKERADKLEAELASLRQQSTATGNGGGQATGESGDGGGSGFDFEAKEQAYQDAILDGDPETAKKIRAEIRAAEKAQMQADFQRTFDTEINRREEEARVGQARDVLNARVAKVIAEHPFLNIKGESADLDAIVDTEALFVRYVADGMAPVDALDKAVNKTLMMRGASGKPAQQQQDARKTASFQRNADAANAQPPRMQSGIGERANEASDVEAMTESQFGNLSKAELAAMRGDTA